jgi:type IV secretion system protein VirB4
MKSTLDSVYAARSNSIAEHVPYRSAVGDGIIVTRDRDLVTSWRIGGVDCTTASVDDVADAHQSLCQAIQTLGRQRVAFWVHRIRRRSQHRAGTTGLVSEVAIDLVQRAHAQLLAARGLFVTEIYLSAVYRPAYASRADLLADLEHHRGICQFIESSLERFAPTRLAETKRNSSRYSDQLRLYSYLLNAIDEPAPLPWGPVHSSLATSALTFNNTHLVIQGASQQRHAVTLDLKEYPPASRPGMLDNIFEGPHEVIETQSFYPLNRRDAETYLKRQRNHLISSGDAAHSQIDEIAAALDGVASQNYLLGEYHYSAAILGSTKEEVFGALASVRGRLNDAGFQSTAIDLIPDFAWFAQLPGNFGYRPRFARLSSRSFCGLAPLHGTASGKARGNPWGEAVTVLEGANRSPVYFNFHATEATLDSLDDKAPGNTLIIGPTGSGKTVLELFLLAESLKFGPRLMLFDKDRGCEIAMRAFGVQYRIFRQGVFTGINPLQWTPTDVNRTFMLRWTSSLLSVTTRESANVLTALTAAIEAIVAFPLGDRTLSVLLQILPVQFNQLRQELARWCTGGAFGWAFDGDASSEPLEDRCAFDLTAMYPTREILVPVMLALLEQLDGWLDGRPFIYVVTECWRALDDPLFSSFIRDKQKTIRKQNGIGIFDTQSPQDLLQSACAVALIEQTATMILLPNPRGRVEDYCDGLKCSSAEFDLIRSMPATDRRFLIKQGNTCLVASLDFQDRKDVVALLSANSASVALLESIRKTQGEQFSDWWPELLAQLQNRRATPREVMP